MPALLDREGLTVPHLRRALGAVTVMLGVIAALAASPPSGASPPAFAIGGARSAAAAAVSSAPCVSGVSPSPCQSTNPQLIIDAISTGDTSACTFNIKIVWGDGSPEQYFVTRGTPDGKSFLAAHTYSAPGSYTITVGVTLASGGC